MVKQNIKTMKKIIFIVLIIVASYFSAKAQTDGINFQGMARNSSGELLANKKISLRLTILLNSETGSSAYVETREVTTNPQGIFSLVIGDQNALTKSANFSEINWGNDSKFLKCVNKMKITY